MPGGLRRGSSVSMERASGTGAAADEGSRAMRRVPRRSGSYHGAMPMRFLVSLQDEDLAIIAWTALAWPFLRANFPGTFGADSILDAGHPLRGLIWTVAAICAFVVIASHDEPVPGRAQRPNINPIDSEPETRIAMFGPLIVGMTLIGAGGLAGLGLNRDFGFAAVFVGIPILVAIRALKMSPALPHRTRRWLLEPY